MNSLFKPRPLSFDAIVQPKVILDDGTQLTTYDVAVVEGTQYRVSAVHFDSLTDLAAKQLIKKWRLKPGDIFDFSYATDFVKKIADSSKLGNHAHKRRSESAARHTEGHR